MKWYNIMQYYTTYDSKVSTTMDFMKLISNFY